MNSFSTMQRISIVSPVNMLFFSEKSTTVDTLMLFLSVVFINLSPIATPLIVIIFVLVVITDTNVYHFRYTIKYFCIFFLIYIFYYLCLKYCIMPSRKTDGVFIRMTPQLKKIFQTLANDKSMSQTNLIEYLIRKEADNISKDDTKKIQ